MRNKIALATFLGVGVLSSFHVAHGAILFSQTVNDHTQSGDLNYSVSSPNAGQWLESGTPQSYLIYINEVTAAANPSIRVDLSRDNGGLGCRIEIVQEILTPGFYSGSCANTAAVTGGANLYVIGVQDFGTGPRNSSLYVNSNNVPIIQISDEAVFPETGVQITRIASTTPKYGQIVATTTTLSAQVYVASGDWVNGTYLHINLVNNTRQNGTGAFAVEAWDAAFGGLDFPLNEGFNEIATSTTFPFNGQVNATWQIKQPNSTFLIGSFLPDETLVSSSTIFYVNQPTALDIILASTSEAFIQAVLTGTTTGQSVVRCNLNQFDITICVISLFIPPGPVLLADFTELKDGFLSRWPLGYITRAITILSNSASSSLPVISATVPSGVIGTGATVTLNANHALDFVLNATTSGFLNSSATSTDTFYTITSRYWDLLIYLVLGLWILRRILGSHLIGAHKYNHLKQ